MTASVTSATLSGSPTYLGPVPMTITITRSPDIESSWTVQVLVCDSAAKTLVFDSGGCSGTVAFPPGVDTATDTIYAAPVRSALSTSLQVAVAYACDPVTCSNIANIPPDPGIMVAVTPGPVTLSAAVSSSVVSPTGSSPEFRVTYKNSNGHLISNSDVDPLGGRVTIAPPTSACALFDSFGWDYSNPNVSAQSQLPLLQPPATESCNIQITQATYDGGITATTSVTYQANPNSADLGPSCPRSGAENMCGLPINLTNGNVWTQTDDYELPGLGGGISLRRTWNSQWPGYSPWIQAGMFGDSWQSTFEKHMQLLSGGKQLLYWRGDGSAWFFTQAQNVWSLSSPADERTTLTYSSKTGYTLTLRDGSVEVYNTNGYLTALQDRNGNRTAITYDGTSFNRVSKVTDAAGRILQLNYGSSLLPKQVTSIQDSVGTIATYAYDSGSHLTSVTYADSSVINYTYDANGLLLSIKRGLADGLPRQQDTLFFQYEDWQPVLHRLNQWLRL